MAPKAILTAEQVATGFFLLKNDMPFWKRSVLANFLTILQMFGHYLLICVNIRYTVRVAPPRPLGPAGHRPGGAWGRPARYAGP